MDKDEGRVVWTFGLQRIREIYWLAKRLLAFQGLLNGIIQQLWIAQKNLYTVGDYISLWSVNWLDICYGRHIEVNTNICYGRHIEVNTNICYGRHIQVNTDICYGRHIQVNTNTLSKTALPPSCTDCQRILGASTSFSPRGLSRPIQGQLYSQLPGFADKTRQTYFCLWG